MSPMLWLVRRRLVSWAKISVGIQSCWTTHRHADVRFVPKHKWYVSVFDSKGNDPVVICWSTGLRRGERGWVGLDPVVSILPRDNPPSCPPANRRDCPGQLLGSSDKRNLMQTVEENKSAVHQRFISRTASALRSILLASVPTPFLFLQTLFMKAFPGSFFYNDQMLNMCS